MMDNAWDDGTNNKTFGNKLTYGSFSEEEDDPATPPTIAIMDLDSNNEASRDAQSISMDMETGKVTKRGRPASSSSTSDNSISTDSTYTGEQSAIFDGRFFKIIEEKDRHIKALCQSCLPKTKYIQGSRDSTANFLKHLKSLHGKKFDDYLCYKKEKKAAGTGAGASRKMRKMDKSQTLLDRPLSENLKQMQIQTGIAKMGVVSQQDFDKRLINFLINTMSAISLIEKPSFRALFTGLNVKVMARRTAINHITQLAERTKDSLRKMLKEVEYVCTTADIWSSKKRSFLGVTCHWITTDFQRVSACLACRRFPGVHSFDKIADLLDEIHRDYGLIIQRIVATLTDNGSNFVKAFKEFGIQLIVQESEYLQDNDHASVEIQEVTAESEQTFVDETDNDDPEDRTYECQTIMADVPNEDGQVVPVLPPHIRCISHTLSLIATADLMKIINGHTQLRKRHTSVIAKCTELWKMSSKPKTAEIIKTVFGHYLSYPGITRWNSYYDAIIQILNNKDKLTVLYDQLKTPSGKILKENDIEYLLEYVAILKPLATTLDILQGEKNMFFGYVLPSVVNLQQKFQRGKVELKLQYLKPVLDGLLTSLKTRFDSYLRLAEDAKMAIIAAIAHPKFKLRWMYLVKNAEMSMEEVKKLVVDEAMVLMEKGSSGSRETDSNDDKTDDFFEFEQSTEGFEVDLESHNSLFGPRDHVELELMQYLQDNRSNLESLHEFPNMKRLFFKFNTILPSSASVERMFNYATFIDAPRRHAISDQNFENLVVLKGNCNLQHC